MPPNTCKTFSEAIDVNVLQLHQSRKSAGESEAVAQQLPREDQIETDSFWQWDSNVPQSRGAIESYWYWDGEEQGGGTTEAKKDDILRRRAEAIARVEEKVAHYKLDRQFSGKGIETILLEASTRRMQEIREVEASKQNAGYWDM